MVTGQHEPNDEEADWPSDEEKEDELAVSVRTFLQTYSLICVKNSATNLLIY